MKILIVNLILYTHSDGVIPKVASIKDTMIYNFAKGFLKQGHDVTLYASEDYKPLDIEEYDFDVIWSKSFLPKVFRPTLIPFPSGLYKHLLHNQYDLVISSEVLSIGSIIVNSICKNRALFWCELSKHISLCKGILSRMYYGGLVKMLFSKSNIVARSEEAADFHAMFCNNVSDAIIEHGIDLEKFNPSSKKNQCIVVSQLIPRKNVKSIIQRFLEFVENGNSEYILYIAGDGPLREELELYVSKSKFPSNVVFTGKIPHSQLASLLAESKALLVDTLKDLNMVSIPEAIVAGTPILMNTVPSSKKYVTANKLGIVKDNWTWENILEVVKSNEFSNNCLSYREKLSNEYLANEMVQIIKNNESTTSK